MRSGWQLVVGLSMICVALVSSSGVGAAPESVGYGSRVGTRPVPLGRGAVLYLNTSGVTFNTPGPGYVLDVNFPVGYSPPPYEPTVSVLNFSVAVMPATGTEYGEMQAFSARHAASAFRVYQDQSIQNSIGNSDPGSGGVAMYYSSDSKGGDDLHTGQVAILNACGFEYLYEIWGGGMNGDWGEDFGDLVHQTDFAACS